MKVALIETKDGKKDLHVGIIPNCNLMEIKIKWQADIDRLYITMADNSKNTK